MRLVNHLIISLTLLLLFVPSIFGITILREPLTESDPLFVANQSSIWDAIQNLQSNVSQSLLDNTTQSGLINDKLPLSGGTLLGNLIISGNLDVLGTYVNATVEQQYLNGSFYPTYDNLFNIGSPAERWGTVYATNLIGALACSNITGATSNLCTIVDTNTGNTTAQIIAAVNGTYLNLANSFGYVETDSAHDACSEISGCVVGAITTSGEADQVFVANRTSIWSNIINLWGYISGLQIDNSTIRGELIAVNNTQRADNITQAGLINLRVIAGACTVNQFGVATTTSGLTCVQPSYKNLSGLPTCTGTQKLAFDGTTLSCNADTDTTYTVGTGLTLVGTILNHTDTSSQATSNNANRVYIQDVTLDTFGHVTGLSTATETVTDTNDTIRVAAIESTVYSGSYTPGENCQDNLDTCSATLAYYVRNNDIVTVSGRISVNPTTLDTNSKLSLSLPIASDLATATDLAGVGSGGYVIETGAFIGNATADTAELRFVATGTSNHVLSYIYQYIIK